MTNVLIAAILSEIEAVRDRQIVQYCVVAIQWTFHLGTEAICTNRLVLPLVNLYRPTAADADRGNTLSRQNQTNLLPFVGVCRYCVNWPLR